MKERRDEIRRASINAEAAEWFVHLKDNDLNARDRRIFLAWLKESPTNIAELLRTLKMYRSIKLANLDPSSFHENASNVVELSTFEDAVDEVETAEANHQTGRSYWKVAATIAIFAASVLLTAIVKVAWFDNTIATGASEWRHLKLDDGSIVRIGPRSRLHVDLGDKQRTIELARGEAYFQVAKDPARPFVVEADSTVVRAIGTEFSVSRLNDRVSVIVADGTVSVMHGGRSTFSRPELQPISLRKGEQLEVSEGRRAPVHKVNVQRELAWTEGKLLFEGSTVAEAVAQFNRRNRVQIVINDPTISAHPIAFAVFDVADPESFAETIALDAGVELVKDGRDTLRLVPRLEDDEEHQPIITQNE
jgi:transmembrane sensor